MRKQFDFHRRPLPGLNTSSTADISFMLLIFFLVATSLDTDKGLSRQLPPSSDNRKEQPALEVEKSKVLSVVLHADNSYSVDGEQVTVAGLKQAVKDKAKSRPKDHVIDIHSSPKACYDAYFQLQHAVVEAYKELRGECAVSLYGRSFRRLSAAERDTVMARVPQRVSDNIDEVEPNIGEKGGRL